MGQKDSINQDNLPVSLKDLIDANGWQKIQDNFSTVTNVGLRTVDTEGNILIPPSGQPRLCAEILSKSPLNERICVFCLPTFLGGRAVVDKNLSFACLPGVFNFLSPLRADDKVFGYLIVGPVVLVMRKSKEEFRKIADELNMELEDLWKIIEELKILSFKGAQSMVELIKDIADYILKTAYQDIIKSKALALIDSPKLSKLLDVLLDVAVQVSGADVGSIMFIDALKDSLTIRAAKGLSNEVVEKTRIKVGDGISGLAAKERRSFLINEKQSDNRIKTYLNRPSIKSSMVIPIQVEEKVVGVMNLGTSEATAVRFNPDNLKLMNRLVDLATVALHQ